MIRGWCKMLATMAHYHVVSIVDFVNQSPGWRTGQPAAVGGPGHGGPGGAPDPFRVPQLGEFARQLTDGPVHLPAVLKPITLKTGQQVLRIGYAAPSPA